MIMKLNVLHEANSKSYSSPHLGVSIYFHQALGYCINQLLNMPCNTYFWLFVHSFMIIGLNGVINR